MGATFENLYLRTRQSDTLMNALEEMMKKRGYTRISNEDAADFSISIHVPASGAWCFVSSDNETPGFLRRLSKALAGLLNTEALFAACDGSDLLKASLFAPSGESAALKIDVTHPAAAPKDNETAIWNRILSDAAAFRQAATAEYTFAEEFLFAVAPLIDLPTENMMYWEADDAATTVLCFAKKPKNGSEKKSVAAMLGAALKQEGFQKLPHGFYKPLNEEMGLCVTVAREKRASYQETRNGRTHWFGTDKTACDLRVCVTNEDAVKAGHFLGTELSLIARIPGKALIVDLVYTAPEVAVTLLQAFYGYVYDPLFGNDRPLPSLFDTMCLWDLHAYGTVNYHSYFKALAAYRENRTFSALFCLKWIFCQNLREPADVSEYNVRILSGEEIDALRHSGRYEALKDCFALYDRLEEPYPFKIG